MHLRTPEIKPLLKTMTIAEFHAIVFRFHSIVAVADHLSRRANILGHEGIITVDDVLNFIDQLVPLAKQNITFSKLATWNAPQSPQDSVSNEAIHQLGILECHRQHPRCKTKQNKIYKVVKEVFTENYWKSLQEFENDKAMAESPAVLQNATTISQPVNFGLNFAETNEQLPQAYRLEGLISPFARQNNFFSGPSQPAATVEDNVLQHNDATDAFSFKRNFLNVVTFKEFHKKSKEFKGQKKEAFFAAYKDMFGRDLSNQIENLMSDLNTSFSILSRWGMPPGENEAIDDDPNGPSSRKRKITKMKYNEFPISKAINDTEEERRYRKPLLEVLHLLHPQDPRFFPIQNTNETSTADASTSSFIMAEEEDKSRTIDDLDPEKNAKEWAEWTFQDNQEEDDTKALLAEALGRANAQTSTNTSSSKANVLTVPASPSSVVNWLNERETQDDEAIALIARPSFAASGSHAFGFFGAQEPVATRENNAAILPSTEKDESEGPANKKARKDAEQDELERPNNSPR